MKTTHGRLENRSVIRKSSDVLNSLNAGEGEKATEAGDQDSVHHLRVHPRLT